MMQSSTSYDAEKMLLELRHLLHMEDANLRDRLEEKLHALEEAFQDDALLKERMAPYLETHVAFLQENFPGLFGKYLGAAIQLQIRESQDEIIDALYPIIGKLIAKFIKTEIEKISQKIDQRLANPFSFKAIKQRLQSIFTGVPLEEIMLRDTALAKLEEVFLIRKLDGLLMGHYSLNEVSNPDMVGGMLTGIKQFMEHAFEKQNQELDTLTYDRYKIRVFNFNTYFVAAVIEGPSQARFQNDLQDFVYKFVEKYDVYTDQPITKELNDQLSADLKIHFDGFKQVDK
ncbi:MAG: hypothetical protein AAFR61_31635 [Bacteroidota bacterium]